MNDLFTLFTSRLEEANIEYMATGSVAAMVYGEPRLTHDIDLVVVLDGPSIDAFVRAFPDKDFYCAPRDVIRVEANRPQRGHFNVIHHESGFKADVYIARHDPLHRWGLARRRRLAIGDVNFEVAPAEYVIVRKLEYYREGASDKHLSDIRGMLRHSGSRIDRAELDTKIKERGLEEQWAAVTVPP